jgi:heterodisulfide reductase subunit A
MNPVARNPKVGAALVVGGGIGGMQAALDLADAGIKVYLLDSKPAIGGVMAQLDKTFPTNDCAMCTMAPRLVEIGRHPDIEIITLAEVTGIEGQAGDYTVTVRQQPRYVDCEKCTGCGTCVQACPLGKLKASANRKTQPIPDEYNEGLSFRPAIYIPYPQAVPNTPTVDPVNCLHMKTGKCDACIRACKRDAIDFDDKEKTFAINVGAVILSPGYQLIDPRTKPAYLYGQHPNVITAVEFERILSASGPFQGKIQRPSDNAEPKRIAFIQCVGSRDSERDYCSSVCCMHATKQALMAKEHLGDLEIDVFYMDLRAYGKGFEAYYERAKATGVKYIRSRPVAVEKSGGDGNLVIRYLAEGERKTAREYDLVVLSNGMQAPAKARQIADVFGGKLNEYDFCQTAPFRPAEPVREGIYCAGTFAEPKDIPETVMHASAAASKVLGLLNEAKGSMIVVKQYPPEIDVAGQALRIGVFVCHCGSNIAGVVDVPKVVEYAKTLPDVVFVENNLYTCSNDAQDRIKQLIGEHRLNRVVVASCSPRTHEPLFRNTCREAGLNPYLFEMANIRDQCSWVHMAQRGPATEKAKDLVRIAVAKSRLLEPLQKGRVPVKKAALVIGGGLAGMTAAMELAAQGVAVSLVERKDELGGNLRHIHYLADGSDPQWEMLKLITKVNANPNIRVFTESKITAVGGSIGDFRTALSTPYGMEMVEHGVAIVATGAGVYDAHNYDTPEVITQWDLESLLADPDMGWIHDTVVMIQCVGSRDEERPYCSRVCCSEAIKNALRIKQQRPRTNVYILYRDIRTYGFREKYYSQAREQGVVFLRYEDDRRPEVVRDRDGVQVVVWSPLLEREIAIDTDLVVLSTGIVPDPSNQEIAQFLKVPRNQDGFFLEAHMKLRPVDFATDGVFVCGMAHAPKSIDETILQAQAAAARASAILAKDYVELEGTISTVIAENCDGCAYCIDVCPYTALSIEEYGSNGSTRRMLQVNDSLCKGCGTCQATCPKEGIVVKGFRPEQLAAQVEAALEVMA